MEMGSSNMVQHTLKFTTSSIRYADITPHTNQNCDVTIIIQHATEGPEVHVPKSSATQLYIQATIWAHESYRNNKFGPPPTVVRSLWTSLVTWSQ